ncbi:DUF6683 family protein [Chitinivorax sp. B]|uniref:DUF6683 family protein n=1 Tax=Chitinivorax sp. B TaxID=2502235 RepID=UPI0010F76EFA|nr:DUF6683 family protein [Chitinivorax sp. B]
MKLTVSRRNVQIAGISLLVSALPAHAYDIPPPPPAMYQGLILPLFPNGNTIPFSGQSGSSERRSKSSVDNITRANGKTQAEANARELAMALPVSQREQMKQVYLQAFDSYRQLERKLGLPANDVAGATAAFIAGNYMAFRNVEVPDASFHQMVTQLRGALTQSQGYINLSATNKRQLYEQSAMVGTFMAVARLSLQQKPNPTLEQNFRETARTNLEAALKVPAEHVRIDEKGLHLGQN